MLRIFIILRDKMISFAIQLIINIVGVELKWNYKLRHFTLYYQQHHTHNCFISQLRWYCAIIPMNEFRNINVLMVQLISENKEI